MLPALQPCEVSALTPVAQARSRGPRPPRAEPVSWPTQQAQERTGSASKLPSSGPPHLICPAEGIPPLAIVHIHSLAPPSSAAFFTVLLE